MQHIEFEYQNPKQIDENLWEVRGSWKNKLGRRMTIIRLSDNRLIIHSSIRLKEEDLEWMCSLGVPAFIVAPNRFHYSDAGWMAEKFPTAEIFAPRSKFEFFKSLGLKPKDVNSEFPASISNDIKCFPMHGTNIEEAAFLHVPSKTLVLCDLAFNMSDVFNGFEKILMKWNKVGGLFGPSRLTKLIFTKNQGKLIDSYRNLLNQDFDRVIVNHGEILETAGRIKLKEGIQRIFGSV